jgi:hypothetical protein
MWQSKELNVFKVKIVLSKFSVLNRQRELNDANQK